MLGIELEKLERRVWNPQWYHVKEEEESVSALDLPVPSSSPSVLNGVPDFKNKAGFLGLLGLKTTSANDRQGMENITKKNIAFHRYSIHLTGEKESFTVFRLLP